MRTFLRYLLLMILNQMRPFVLKVTLHAIHFNYCLGYRSISERIGSLDPSKACGPDGIPIYIYIYIYTKLLRETSSTISYLDIHASLVQGKFLLIGKKHLSPQFTKKLTDPSNYRPISFPCICCKLFNLIIYFLWSYTNWSLALRFLKGFW